MRKVLILFLLVFLVINTAKSLNNDKRSVEAVKVTENPKIDGLLNEAVWEKAAIAKDFF